MNKRKVTIKDVAKEAGVSFGLVSFVLNDTKGQSIPESTRRKVLDAVKTLEYVPNVAAKGMRTKKSMCLGLVSFWDVGEPVFIEILKGLYKVADDHGYTIVICNLNNNEHPFSYIDLFKRQQIDGILFISPYDAKNGYNENEHINIINENSIPAVIIHGHTNNQYIDYINVDHYGTTFMAVEYLVSLGHTKIGYLMPDENEVAYIASARLNGFRAGMSAFNTLLKEEFIFRISESEWITKQIAEGSGPTGIVANKSDYAAELLKIFISKGIKVPDTVSVIAANTVPYNMRLYPPLTSVRIPFEDMGKKGVELLLERIKGNKQTIQVQLPNTLCIKKSCTKCEE